MALDEIIAIFDTLLDRCKDEGRHSISGLALYSAAYEPVEL